MYSRFVFSACIREARLLCISFWDLKMQKKNDRDTYAHTHEKFPYLLQQ